MDLDQYQEEIGGISKYQIAVIIAAGLVAFGQSMTSQAVIFLNAVPKHRCALPQLDNCNLTEETILNISIPIRDKGFSSCEKYNFSHCSQSCNSSCFRKKINASITFCEDGYVYDYDVYGNTIASEFDLVCDRRYLDTIAQTLFFAGFFLGSAIIGPLSDWFGRRTAVGILGISFAACSVATALSPSYAFYTIARIFVGACNIGVYIAMFVYVSEISTTKWRTEACVWAYLTPALSHTLFPAWAYICKDWRKLQYVLAFFPTPFVLLYCFLPESPRWLMANNKFQEARKIIKRYSSSNGKTLTDDTWKLIVKTEKEKNSNDKLKSEVAAKKIRVWDLFRRPMMRLMCFNVMISWFTVSVVFYGLSLNGGNLAGDPYINVAINSFVEVFAAFGLIFAYRFGRRTTLSTSYVGAGLSCIFALLFSTFADGSQAMVTASTIFAVVGKFFACLGYDIMYVVTMEMFPTVARSTGVGIGSMAARVGAMLSPLILEVQRSVPWFSQTVFGVLTIISGLMTLIYPETSTIDLITSLDEAEEYFRKNMAIKKFFQQKASKHEPKDLSGVPSEEEKDTLMTRNLTVSEMNPNCKNSEHKHLTAECKL